MLHLSLRPLEGDKNQQHCPLLMGQFHSIDSLTLCVSFSDYNIYRLNCLVCIINCWRVLLLHSTQCLTTTSQLSMTPSHFHWWAKFPDWLRQPWKSFQSGRLPFSRADNCKAKIWKHQLLSVYRGIRLVIPWLRSQNGHHRKRSGRQSERVKLPSDARNCTS